MKAIRIHQTGGPDVLKYEELPIPKPEKNQVLIKNHSIGVNFIDTYHRTGLYKVPLPFVLGRDGAGIVEKIGEGVTEVKVGDRVAYPDSTGSYAEYVLAPAQTVAVLPDKISFDLGTAAMVSGLTAHYLVKGSYFVKKGDTIFVHAAAGGLGQLLCQIGKHFGARVIGTTSSEEKAKVAKEAGCDEVILYTQKDFEEETKKLTQGKGVDVVYDSVGKDTALKSLNILGRRGVLVLCGNASGPAPPIDPALLARGSYSVTRPKLGDFITTREEFVERTQEVFKWIQEGIVNPTISLKLPLKDAALAHIQLEGRKTVGKILLTVD